MRRGGFLLRFKIMLHNGVSVELVFYNLRFRSLIGNFTLILASHLLVCLSLLNSLFLWIVHIVWFHQILVEKKGSVYRKVKDRYYFKNLIKISMTYNLKFNLNLSEDKSRVKWLFISPLFAFQANAHYCVWGLCQSWEYCCAENVCCTHPNYNIWITV